jgi:hypothetical protein
VASPTFWVVDFWPSAMESACDQWRGKEECSPGWTALAALSAAPETFSPILEVVDFWESGVTANVSVLCCGGWLGCMCSLFSDACSPRPLRRLSDMLMVGWLVDGLVVKD